MYLGDSFFYWLYQDPEQITYRGEIRQDGDETVIDQIDNSFDKLFPDIKVAEIAIYTPKSTIVPTSLYSELDSGNYLSRITDVEDTESEMVDSIPGIYARNIYAVEDELYRVFRNWSIRLRFYHIHTAFANTLRSMDWQLDDDHTLVFVRKPFLVLHHYSKNQLIFANVFEITDAADAVYYLQLMKSALKINTSGELMIYGDQEYHQLLKKEFRRVWKRMVPAAGHRDLFSKWWTSNLDDLTENFDLYCLSGCA